jgi:hypothetical protein
MLTIAIGSGHNGTLRGVAIGEAANKLTSADR